MMRQKILVAFDDSENAMRAVEHVARYFQQDSEVTLFSVIPDYDFKCLMDLTSLNPHQVEFHDSICRDLQNEKKRQLEILLRRAKNILLESGFDEKKVTIKIDRKSSDVAGDIVKEAAAGYHTIVMGRRGRSALKELFLGSISQKVLHAAKETSVLIVG